LYHFNALDTVDLHGGLQAIIFQLQLTCSASQIEKNTFPCGWQEQSGVHQERCPRTSAAQSGSWKTPFQFQCPLPIWCGGKKSSGKNIFQ